MKFSYKICDIGWADAHIDINGSEEYFSVSYLTNALKDLLESVISLLPECVPEDEIKNQVTFEWHAEPGGNIWSIESINNNKVHILIESYNDLSKKTERKIPVNEVCDKTDFIKCIVSEMDNIIKEYGLVGYRETWYRHDFPISAYLKLKNYLITGETFPIEHNERYPGNEYSRSELNKELMLFDT